MATKLSVLLVFFFFFCFLNAPRVTSIQILSKSKLDKCEKSSDSNNLNCTRKIILNLAVPTGSSGGEASLVAEIVEVEENSTNKMQTLRIPPVVTINKSAVYALYELTYIRDVPYKPQEYYVQTRKCEPDADAKVLQICERLRDENGHIMEHTQPVCCPCGPQHRIPSSCGNVFDKILKGKANTAHCLRFPGDWFHVFGIGQRSIGFSVRVEIKTGKRFSEVMVGPENRTAISNDKFLRVNLVGDFGGYSNIPSFEEFYLVIPRQVGDPGQLKSLGTNFSMWMLLERVRFTLDGLECNKIGVSYEAFNGQPDFCSAPFWSCLHNQLWNFWGADQNRLTRHQLPLYGIQGRFERINQHPNAGTHSFSIGVMESLNTNLLIELSADDIEYVYQRSPGKIINVTVPTFEALTQSGIATITTKNTGEVEASYSLTFDCTRGIKLMEEQFFIMKPNEVLSKPFKLYPSTDQAAKYTCAVILKDSDFIEVDRAECQFSTTATVLDNGTQVGPFQPPKTGFSGFFESIKNIWNRFWEGVIDFITGKSCRSKCSGFFDFSCHIQYICISWLLLFGLFLAILPTVLVLLWLLHQKGVFDPLYDWCEDHFLDGNYEDTHRHKTGVGHPHIHHSRYHGEEVSHKRHGTSHKRRNVGSAHRHMDKDHDYNYYLNHVNKDKFKHRHSKHSTSVHQVALHGPEDDSREHYKHRKERTSKGHSKVTQHGENRRHEHERHSHEPEDDTLLVLHHKRRR